MADKDYYCTTISPAFRGASDALTEGDTQRTTEQLVYAVCEAVRRAVQAGHCPIDQYTLALTSLAQLPLAQREAFIFEPLPRAPGKVAELARRAAMDIATEIQFLDLVPSNLAQELLLRTCGEVQEFELLTRLQINIRLGVMGAAAAIEADLTEVRCKTQEQFRVLVGQQGTSSDLAQFRVPKPRKQQLDTTRPMTTMKLPLRPETRRSE